MKKISQKNIKCNGLAAHCIENNHTASDFRMLHHCNKSKRLDALETKEIKKASRTGTNTVIDRIELNLSPASQAVV